MATIRISDSLIYGTKFFLLFLAVVVVGGGGMVLGGALVVPEVQAYLDGTGVDTASLAGGVILALLGTVAWFSGTFALAYKLIGDAVAEGANLAPTTQSAATTSQQAESGEASAEPTAELGPSPGEQAAAEHGPGQTVPGEASATGSADGEASAATGAPTEAGEPRAAETDDSGVVESDEPASAAADAGGTDEATTATSGPGEQSAEAQDSGSDQPPERATRTNDSSGQPQSNEEKPAAGRERTAEEIAFGSSSREESTSGPPGDDTAAGEESADTSDIPLMDTDADDGEFEADETVAGDRKNVETDNDSSADPLADNFDE